MTKTRKMRVNVHGPATTYAIGLTAECRAYLGSEVILMTETKMVKTY